MADAHFTTCKTEIVKMNSRMRKTVIALLMMLQCIAVSAKEETLYETISKNFVEYYTSGGGIQEKLYVATDKPYYSAGDTIYFSAFLVNSIYFDRTTDSKFIYVELINATGDIISRIKVLGEDGRFNNAIPLPTRITAGRYTLRAYTRWQTNFDNRFLFTREITIGNYIDDTIQTSISYEFDGSGRVHATVMVTNNMFTPVTDRPIEYMLRINGRNSIHTTMTDKEGKFNFSFRPTEDNTDCIRLNINANNRKLNRVMQLPSFKEDFSVQFLPEGGNLIAGIEQVVAFRAVGANGRPIDVKGYIATPSGEEICKIESIHSGMGKFTINARAGERYIAHLSTVKHVSRTFTLPVALSSGCAINMEADGSKRALLRILSTPDINRSEYIIIVQSRGLVNYVVEDLEHTLRIPLDKLRSGVAMVSLVHKEQRKVIAERLFFVKGEHAKIDIKPSVGKVERRSKIALDFKLRNSKGENVRGDFMVAVTDADMVQEDASTDNILSYMLLHSDLRGKIENPTFYFEKDDNEHNEMLDLVMLTHGWRRYDLSTILTGQKAKIKYLPEKMQSISGRILGLAGKARNASVMIYRNRKEYLGVHPLNKTNRFSITGIDSADTTTYLLQALNRDGGSARMRIKIDPLVYPETPVILRNTYSQVRNYASMAEKYLMEAKRNYYNEGGERVIDIDEVVVTAKRIYNYDYSSSLNDFNTVSGDMTRFVSIFDALQRFRQLEITGNSVRVRSKHIAKPDEGEYTEDNILITSNEDEEERVPNVYVNGQMMDINAIDAYPMNEIISVSYLDKDESLGATLGGEYGSIILQVRNIDARHQFLINSMAQVVVPGYAAPVEFYAPDYSVRNDEKADNRTTIAWYPLVKANALGDSAVSFYAADRKSNYRVVVEGITSDGELIYNEIIIPAK